MRTTKRFTPVLLDRFRREGRGTGSYQNYIPWHRVGRSDPASRGRSHLLVWRGRQREWLSDKELIGFLFATMLQNVDDAREQFPLSLNTGQHELAAYDVRYANSTCVGTLQIADNQRVKHPRVNGGGLSAPWVMTTDLLLTLRASAQDKKTLLAIAFKQDDEIAQPRTRQLLRIEKAYWDARGVEWLLVTPSLYEELPADCLRNVMPWALGKPVDPSAMESVREVNQSWPGLSMTSTLERLAQALGDIDHAQRALWQAVWAEKLPLDLRRSWRPHHPLQLLSLDEFRDLNPIAVRRSAWI